MVEGLLVLVFQGLRLYFLFFSFEKLINEFFMAFQTLSNSAGHAEPFHSQDLVLTFQFLMPPLPPNYVFILTFILLFSLFSYHPPL